MQLDTPEISVEKTYIVTFKKVSFSEKNEEIPSLSPILFQEELFLKVPLIRFELRTFFLN